MKRFQRLTALSTLGLLAFVAACGEAPAQAPLDRPPLDHAHSHNDYNHTRPLLDALDLGFCSIEADVWLVGDELLVGHAKSELKPDRTLESLYLRPLAERCKKHGGWVYDPGRSVTFLIDLKTAGKTYDVLKRQLERRRALLEPRTLSNGGKGSASARPIVVVISGERPLTKFSAERSPLSGMDGRIADFSSEPSAERMPLVSDSWPTHFTWRGVGEIPDPQREKLRRLVAEVHASGRRLRFWATPDNEAMWTTLLDEGVDLIGADDIQKLAKFLAARPPKANLAK